MALHATCAVDLASFGIMGVALATTVTFVLVFLSGAIAIVDISIFVIAVFMLFEEKVGNM